MFVAKRLFSEYSMRQVRGVQFDGGIRLPTSPTSQLIFVALNEWGNIIELMVFRRRRRVGACVLMCDLLVQWCFCYCLPVTLPPTPIEQILL